MHHSIVPSLLDNQNLTYCDTEGHRNDQTTSSEDPRWCDSKCSDRPRGPGMPQD